MKKTNSTPAESNLRSEKNQLLPKKITGKNPDQNYTKLFNQKNAPTNRQSLNVRRGRSR